MILLASDQGEEVLPHTIEGKPVVILIDVYQTAGREVAFIWQMNSSKLASVTPSSSTYPSARSRSPS
jgi:hypothetical protein